jgi:hypothetical protein
VKRLLRRSLKSVPLVSAFALMLILVSGCHGHKSVTGTDSTSDTGSTVNSSASQSATTDTSGTYGGARTPPATTPVATGPNPGAIGTSGGVLTPPGPAQSTTGGAEPTTPAPAGTPDINSKSVVRKN